MSANVLTVHHLGISQSERIVWLCEELELTYKLKYYERRKDNKMAPGEYQSLHPVGTAPVITDGNVVLGESGAVVEYVIKTYGNGQFTISPEQPEFADYLYWFHFANGTLQPLLMRVWLLERLAPSSEAYKRSHERFERVLSYVNDRLGQTPYLAGPELTAADIMTVFSLTTMRVYWPYELTAWPNIVAYLQRIGERPAYRRAIQKAYPAVQAGPGEAPVH